MRVLTPVQILRLAPIKRSSRDDIKNCYKSSFPDSQDLPKSLVKPKKFRFLRFFRKMYRGDTIRPRRTNQWMNAVDNHIVKNRTPLFHIGEYNTPDHSSIHISQQGKDKTVKKDKEKSIAKKWLTQVENYCDSTTLHGLKYVGDTSLTLGERAFWLVAFSIAICAAGYYISIIYQKWNSSPVIISFSPFDADLTHIPFPAITICNMNQAKKSEAEKTLLNGPDAERKILYGLCNDDNQTLGDYKNETTDNTSWETLRDFLLKVGTPCADMLRLCKWRNDIISCEDAFNNDLTDEGLCCSFNRLPDVKIYRNIKELGVLNRTYPDKVYDWSPEKGFSENETGEENYIPRRPLGAGAHLGLTIVLDAQIDNYYCSSTSSIGFKVILSNPLETPKMADFGFLLNPGSESRIAITPSIREATDNLRNIDIQKRQCFFASERRLKYYRTYTSRNCGQECLSNYTYEQCSCIPYYLPRKNYMKICELSDNECVRRAKNVMEISYKGKTCDCLPGCYEIVYSKSRSFADIPSSIDIIPDNFTSYNKTYFATYTQRNCNLECLSNYTMATCQCVPYYLPRATKTKVCGWDMDLCTANAKKNMEQTNGNASSCHCLPGCYELSFTESKSNSDLSTKLDLKEDTIFVNVKDSSESYIVKNMAVVHFYFTATKFTKQIKSELYGFTEILSNVGGLLGLCMGFSFLSFVELIYFVSLKIVCKYVRAHRKQRKNREKNRYPYVR